MFLAARSARFFSLPLKTAVRSVVSGPSPCRCTSIQSRGIRNADQLSGTEEKLSLSAFCCCLAQSCHFEGVYSEVFMHLPSGHNGRHFINCQPTCLKPLVHIVSFSLINLEEFISCFNSKSRHRISAGPPRPF